VQFLKTEEGLIPLGELLGRFLRVFVLFPCDVPLVNVVHLTARVRSPLRRLIAGQQWLVALAAGIGWTRTRRLLTLARHVHMIGIGAASEAKNNSTIAAAKTETKRRSDVQISRLVVKRSAGLSVARGTSARALSSQRKRRQ
jgi:hypothetical protein